MSGRICKECGSQVPKLYVMCDICGEPFEEEKASSDRAEAVGSRPDAHPGYEIRTGPEPQQQEEMSAEEAAASVWSSVLGKTGQPRARIMYDGSVTILDGRVLGFLNDQLQVASAQGHLLGYVLSDQVYDETDTEVGSLNRGTGTLRNALGSTLIDVDGIGCCRGHTGLVLGQFEGLGFKELSQIALYALFLDPDFYDERTDDLEHVEATAEQPEAEAPPPVVEAKLPNPEKVEEKVQVKRTDFVRPALRSDLFQKGSADKVTMELMNSNDVASLDFQSRMALWSVQERQKKLALQPKMFVEGQQSVSVSDSIERKAPAPLPAKAPSTSPPPSAVAAKPVSALAASASPAAPSPVKVVSVLLLHLCCC
jgi:hypothetical protein